MAFSRPSLTDLVDRIQADFVSRFTLNGPVLRRSVIYVLARVLAGAAHSLYGYLNYLSRQIFPDTADDTNLRRWGSIWGLSPTAATYSSGSITITGTDGTVVPAASKLIRSDGAEYSTAADVTIASGTATATVTAVAAGVDGNCDAGTVLSFESPIANIDTDTTVAVGGLAGGADEETTDDFRTRVLARLQDSPQGGSSADYVAWAKEVAGVTRAWVYPLALGAGTVVVRFMRDNDANPIPDSTAVADVQSHIDSVRPVTATVTVAAPIADALDFTLSITPDTTATRAAVQAELTDLLSREVEPGVTLPISQIRTAIGNATGLTDYTLSSPSADVVPSTGHVPTLGTFTWT